MPTNLTGTGFINHGSAAWIRKIWMRDRIYNYMRGYRYKARYRIQENSRYRYKNWGTDTKGGTGFKKNQGTDRKTKVPIRYRTKKNAVLHKTKLKGGNRHQNKNSECRFCEKYHQFTVPEGYLSPMKRGEVPRWRNLWIQKILPPRGEIVPEPGRRIRNWYRILWRPLRPHRPSPRASLQPRQAR
jgi:hypothetical protein